MRVEVWMYIPSPNLETDRARLHDFVRRYGFGLLVTGTPSVGGESRPFATHLPFLLDADRGAQGVLRGHMARANPQWRDFQPGLEVLAVFSGPHAFISSNWYEEPDREVPTWNYATVHVYGTPRLVEQAPQIYALLQDMMAFYQPEGSPLGLQPPTERVQALARGIVAFEIEVTGWEGKFKLSQNRTAADRRRVRDALEWRGSADDRAIAALMRDWEARPVG
jgi:transcriptional regulator